MKSETIEQKPLIPYHGPHMGQYQNLDDGIGWMLLFAQTTVPLANGLGEKGTKPVIESDKIMFNGVEDDSHETCCIVKGVTDFDFCKTSHKPYDAVVVEVLKTARIHNLSIELSSDGDNVFGNET